MLYPERLAPIADFLSGLGIVCAPGAVPADSFLPGVAVVGGGLVYDVARLGSPGDLLHEGAHLALVPARFRPLLSDDVDAAIAGLIDGSRVPDGVAPPGAEEKAMLAQTEVMAVAWSYAAAHALKVEIACVFWPGTYRMPAGQAPDALVTQIEQGFFVGIQWLARFGFCTAPPPFGNPMEAEPFPAMRRWLAD
jgi:hypothetical protein